MAATRMLMKMKTKLPAANMSPFVAAAIRRSSASASTEAAKEYEEYRRSLYGEVTHKAVLVDAVGTLVVPAQPMAQVYKTIGEKYGVEYSEEEILDRYRWAYEQPWGRSRLRYVDDGRPFWQFIVSSSTGCSDPVYFEELYNYYTTDKAWRLCDPDAENVFKALRKSGVKSAVVSNFDTRLRPLLQALKCDNGLMQLRCQLRYIAISVYVAAENQSHHLSESM
ncbi:N-acylneuraminate-9-phosphatase isoform X1 [Iris pallida]|uniref:N-acylneuraminate-9-phosphatase isoform X1 n=1 Tax=Iris pallida TaxID=29817 RepID=A0AAX6GT13_IRIPA|nr:N-acylneuraminate-9-phosphatase isoform X1 [Iris pallida]